MHEIEFLVDSFDRLLEFPKPVVRDAGQQLRKVQAGGTPDDWKPMPSIGRGVKEIRLWDATGTFRVIYVVKTVRGVVVLHAFVKKTQQTPKKELELARRRLKLL